MLLLRVYLLKLQRGNGGWSKELMGELYGVNSSYKSVKEKGAVYSGRGFSFTLRFIFFCRFVASIALLLDGE